MTVIKKLKIIILLVILLVAGIIIYLKFWQEGELDSIVASGVIEATEVDVSFKIPGRIESLNIKEGDKIIRGEQIARLDSKELLALKEQTIASLEAARSRLPQLLTSIEFQERTTKGEIARAEAALAAAEAKLEMLIRGARPQEREQAEHTVRQAEAALAAAEAKLEMLIRGARPQEREQAEHTVRQAEAAFSLSTADLKRMEPLYRDGVISGQQFDQYKTKHDTARAQFAIAKGQLTLVKEGPREEEIRMAKEQVEQAKQAHAITLQQLSLVKEGPRQEEISIARAQVAQNRAALTLAKSLELELVRKKQEITTIKAQIKQAEASLKVTETQLSETITKAPLSGVVLKKNVEAGETIPGGRPIITIANLEELWVKIYIKEDKIGLVKLGQRAIINTDSYPERNYEGKVSFISSEAEFTPKNVQTQEERVKLVFAIKVDVKNINQELKPGMPADVQIPLR